MSITSLSLIIESAANGQITNITPAVQEALEASSLQDGILTIFCPSATSALTTLEYESGCINDLQRLFDQIIPPDQHYAHNARWGDGNGHSHVRAALLRPSFTVPIVSGRLTLGTWQQIVFVDFDNRPRHRELVLQFMGE
jgi:secondary thiamine-phosphate synthase enzyme